jgi:hypothetical protein
MTLLLRIYKVRDCIFKVATFRIESVAEARAP